MARKMKDSGIEWIGEIPEGWEVAPLKRFASIQTGNTPTKTSDSNYYASTGIPWIKPDNLGYSHSISKTSEYLTSEGALCARIMPPNTVYVCCIGSLGKVGYSSISCACNQQINALIFNDLMFWKYGYYLTIAQESQYLLFGNGNVLQIINSTSQGNIACVLPPLENQHLIACYLDSVYSDIEVLISKARSSIEEYKKLKQAVITQAVTKGVRGKREMKDSGVEWIGKVPSKWNCIKIKYLFEIRKRIAGKEGYTVLSITQTGIKPKNISSNEGQLADSYSNYQLLYFGEFAMNHMDLLTGWVDISNYNGVTSPDYRVFSLKDTITNHPRYFLYLMQMCYFNRIFYSMAQGVSNLGRWRLQSDKFLNCIFPVPSIEEQKEISDYLDTTCSEIDKLIAKKEQLVKELESYKKSLIYEVVTGKREV